MNDVRRLGIGREHWYAVAPAASVRGAPVAARLWGEAIVLFRDSGGNVHALEDRCPHRQVRLSAGQVTGGELECLYHGWRFAGAGHCTYAPHDDRPPACRVRTYPVREQDGFVWIYPGTRAGAQLTEPFALPEWDHLNYIASVSTIACRAHYSYVVENLMDMHHGHLHQQYQAWGAARLVELFEEPGRVDALYTADSYYRIDRIWSVAQLFLPALRRPHPEKLQVSYVYPHWRAELGRDFRLGCLVCPEDERSTRAWFIHFTSLEAFVHLHRLPTSFRRFVKQSLFGTARGLLDNLVRQDVEMMEQEQAAHDRTPERANWEPNRALAAVQRLIAEQARPVAPG